MTKMRWTGGLIVLAMIAATAGVRADDPKTKDQSGDRARAKEQVEFGIRVAQNNLWNEAMFRWQKATQLDPSYAPAWNDLAIAYEHEGRFDDAKKAYDRALELDSKNLMIKQNYDLFKEINDRTKRRSGK